ncbi:hypothetical protein EAI_14940 [Harpegnathos saltator]|uniref:Uncharacterized protein n=1 Tax=Harpegnathos saltator TaxID=610380 RepID=E2BWN3_HARSA|nr:hypothetical protein EAI_14940 [Harpegnathos saltator]
MNYRQVLGPPNWRTYLMEDKLTRPIFGWMPSEEFVAYAALAMILLLICCIIIGSTLYIRFRESLKVSPAAVKEKMRTGKLKTKDRKIAGVSASIETGNESTTDDTVQLEKAHGAKDNEHRARKSENFNHDAMKSHQSRSKRGTAWPRRLFKNKSKSGREDWSSETKSTVDETSERTNLISDSDTA